MVARRALLVALLSVTSVACLGEVSIETAPQLRSLGRLPRTTSSRSCVAAPSLLAMAPPSGMSQILAFPVTCFFFFFEALLHFHIGKTGQLGISLPSYDELVKIVVSIVICSGLSSGTVMLFESLLAKRRASQ
jgi:hypothetical protein